MRTEAKISALAEALVMGILGSCAEAAQSVERAHAEGSRRLPRRLPQRLMRVGGGQL